MVNISDDANRVLNVVKAKYGLNDKSAAINMVVSEYADGILEPELRPEYVEKIKRREKGPMVRIKDIDEFLGLKKKTTKNRKSARH